MEKSRSRVHHGAHTQVRRDSLLHPRSRRLYHRGRTEHRPQVRLTLGPGPKETTHMTAPIASNTLGVNVFTAPGKVMAGERPKPFGEALGFDPMTSTLIFGEYDAVLGDAMTTVAETEALADWVALHNRNLETIYITHAHFDH